MARSTDDQAWRVPVCRGVLGVGLQSYIDGYDALDRVVRRILTTTPGGATVSEIVAGIAGAPELADAPGGADFGSFTGTMVVRKKLEQVGATSTEDPPMDRRFGLPTQ
jgi:hypothetical protein